MKNQSVSDFVAASMNAVLNSKEHKSLFDVQYKYAQDMNDAKKGKCADCDKSKEDCKCDSSMADDDDNDARKSKDKDSNEAWDNDDNDARKDKDSDSSDADDDDNDARKKKDEDEASDGLETSVAYDVAIDSLLTASAALDSVGLGRGSAFSLKLASLVVEAKKKDKDAKKDKKKDSQSAKDKKSDSKKDDKKKSDSKKDDKKKDSQSAKDKKSDSKKDDKKKSNPFAKKK